MKSLKQYIQQINEIGPIGPVTGMTQPAQPPKPADTAQTQQAVAGVQPAANVSLSTQRVDPQIDPQQLQKTIADKMRSDPAASQEFAKTLAKLLQRP